MVPDVKQLPEVTSAVDDSDHYQLATFDAIGDDIVANAKEQVTFISYVIARTTHAWKLREQLNYSMYPSSKRSEAFGSSCAT
jgi:hypothetical protein